MFDNRASLSIVKMHYSKKNRLNEFERKITTNPSTAAKIYNCYKACFITKKILYLCGELNCIT